MDYPQFTGNQLHNPHNQQQENFSVAFLLQIINGIADPVFVKDRRHCWVLLNDTFCDFIRHSREELQGMSDYDFFPKQEADVFWDTDELVFTTGITNENEEHFTDACGVNHVICTKKSLFVDETGNKFLVGTIRDITKNVTKYQRVEAELRHSQQLLQLAYGEMETLVQLRTQQLEQINEALQAKIAQHEETEAALIRSNAVLQAQQEAAPDGILVVDENRTVVSFNQRFAQLWEIPDAVLQTRNQRQLMVSVLEKVENPHDFLAKVEYLYHHPEETSRDEISFRDERILDRYSTAVHSLGGDYYGRIWYFRDITQSKRSQEVLRKSEARLRLQAKELEQALEQLQRTQIQLVQSEKMSSLGQLVAGIAHEINNPVNFIYGNISYTKEYTQDLLKLLELYQQHYPHPVREIQDYLNVIELDFLRSDLSQILKSMKVGAERIQRIVLCLRTFSRLDEAEMKTVDIHEGIDSTLMILQSRLNANNSRPAIEVIKEYSNLPPVECYPGQLNQVFINILTNAIDALEEGVAIGWGFNPKGCRESLIPSIWIRTKVVEPNRVIVRIADNGPGVPEEVKQRIFDPFFTTKPIGKGTGLGLSISYQIVTDRHGGSLQCISEPGQGAEFVVDIPLAQESQTPSS